MKDKVKIIVGICCFVVFVASGLVWFAHGQTTNTSYAGSGFQKPLVRDLQLIGEVRALTQRVEALEDKVKKLETSRGGRTR